jgi:branched-chain amino acid transport system permease protein
MIVILGGMGTLWGPVVGAFVVLFLEDWLSTLTDRVLLIMGALVLAIALFLPQGIAGLFRRRPAPAEGDDDA